MVAYSYNPASFSGGQTRRQQHFWPGWRAILGFSSQCQPPMLEAVRKIYRERAKTAHPDHGGSDARMAVLNAAMEAAEKELAKSPPDPNTEE